jgi:hypothetical protein
VTGTREAGRGEARSFLFVFRAYPDVDHMAPLAWKLLEAGERVYAVISPGYDPGRDYRLRFLLSYPEFHLYQTAPPDHAEGRPVTLRRARSVIRRSLPWALAFMVSKRVSVVAVEWGYGLREGYENLRSRRGILDLLRSVLGSIRHFGYPRQVRTNFMVAASILGRPTVCLPHGLNIKLGRGSANGDLLPGPLDWRDRNRFAAHVFNTEHHRRFVIARAKGDPAVTQTWGSLRWAPEWFELNLSLAPPFSWPSDAGERLKIVYMVPKWNNHVDKDAVISLLKRLHAMEEISLAIKGHPRPEDGSPDPLRDDPEIDWSRIGDVTACDSVSVIREADVVIDVGSSIGIEVVMQGKVLVNPTYLHDFHTFFDELPGTAVVALSADEVVAYLRRHAVGQPEPASEEARNELLRHAVYGSRSESYDVIDAYRERFQVLAAGGRVQLPAS